MQPPPAPPVPDLFAPAPSSAEARRPPSHQAILVALQTLWLRRRLVGGITLGAAITAVVISLLLSPWYRSSARVLMPEGGGSTLGAMLGNLSPQASRLLGGGSSTDYSRYLAILTSDSVADRVIEEFDLTRVYRKADHRWPLTTTRALLRKRTEFEVDIRYSHLSISVLDQDRERAAAMANFYVDELNRRHMELSALNAGNYRRYIEGRHRDVVAALDSAQRVLQRLQEELGVIELPSTAEAMMRGMADQRSGALRAEMEYQALLRQYGPENPRVEAAREALRVARSAEQAALSGRDPLLPIGQAELPEAVNRYATAYREVLLQSEMLKVTQPLYEQARFEEEREKMAVQVVDRAVPAERKASPRRSLIVIFATFSAFALAVLFVLASSWLDRYRARLNGRLDLPTPTS